jgi:hypothetical protein
MARTRRSFSASSKVKEALAAGQELANMIARPAVRLGIVKASTPHPQPFSPEYKGEGSQSVAAAVFANTGERGA